VRSYIECSTDALDQIDEELPNLLFDLLLALQTCPAARLLRSNNSRNILLTDLSRLSFGSAVISDDFDFDPRQASLERRSQQRIR